MFTHPDEQCSDGYSGTLCLVCATDYVKVGDECKECPGGASFEAALVPLLVLCGLLYCFVVIVLVRTSGAANGESDDTNDNVVQRETIEKSKQDVWPSQNIDVAVANCCKHALCFDGGPIFPFL